MVRKLEIAVRKHVHLPDGVLGSCWTRAIRIVPDATKTLSRAYARRISGTNDIETIQRVLLPTVDHNESMRRGVLQLALFRVPLNKLRS